MLVDRDPIPGQIVGAHQEVGPSGARDALARAIGELRSGGGLSGPSQRL